MFPGLRSQSAIFLPNIQNKSLKFRQFVNFICNRKAENEKTLKSNFQLLYSAKKYNWDMLFNFVIGEYVDDCYI